MTSPRREPALVILPIAVFLSAFLLFQIQPLISKAILPWFGGTSAVWTVCLLFFQTGLFAGYLYAHLIAARLPRKAHALLHLALLAAAVILLQVLPDAAWKPTGGDAPIHRILAVLTVTVGLPYVVLSATGPLLQWWYSLLAPGRSPYWLYALSNAGSLLALLSFPFLVEPNLTLRQQATGWSIGFWAFAALCGACALRVALLPGAGNLDDSPVQTPELPPTLIRRGVWFGLAMVASAMLMALTNHVSQDVVFPFLWVLPLSLYLLSFILCFESDRWYQRPAFAFLSAAAVLGLCWMILHGRKLSLANQAGIYFSCLFVVCMLCHGELARLRPGPRFLTAFYLTLSAGGAAGGLLVAVVAPLTFNDYWEFHVLVSAVALITVAVGFDSTGSIFGESATPWFVKLAAVGLLGAVGAMLVKTTRDRDEVLAIRRNFYGVLKVAEALQTDQSPDAELGNPPWEGPANSIVLRHGHILHGLQYAEPELRMVPSTYYSERSGAGRAVAALRERQAQLRIGVVGLGTGTLAAYGHGGDALRFYEINEDVLALANEHFTYLKDTLADVDVVLGDARLSLERESPQGFDLLVVDAFSGDAIPIHLLTKEALGVYLEHMAPDGIIAFHISNLYFDLRPVVDAIAETRGLSTATIEDRGTVYPGDATSVWTLVARDPSILEAEGIAEAAQTPQSKRVLWTDDHSNLFRALQ
ncbi:MAG: fused MFS/spermidine synthase [Planctomyces sp.]|nr:fused MFS/spermidine synthase [Planctomyces sp.]